MRWILTIVLVSGMAWGQAESAKPASPAQDAGPATAATAGRAASGSAQASPAQAAQTGETSQAAQNGAAAAPANLNTLTIPAGTKLPLTLKQSISTKNAREDDPVYAETAFPFVMNDRIVVPAGTYIQGRVAHVERAGHGKGRSEILIHFTSMIFPSGYTLMLPASVENTPGAENNGVKDQEGTIQADKDTGKRAEDALQKGVYGAGVGSVAGAAAGGLNGLRYGGLAGLAGGVAWALLKRGPDVRLEVGTSIEMEVQRPITVDATRIQMAKAGP